MKKRNDVLFLCQFFYPEYISSATLPFDTAVALIKEGFSVGALCGYPKEYNLIGKVPKEEIYKRIKIKRLKYLQIERSTIIGRLVNYFSFTIAVTLHFKKLSNYRTIIVYSNPPVLPFIATIAGKVFNTKIVFVCYDIYPEIATKTNTIDKNSIIIKIMSFVNRIVFRHVNKVVALSNEMKTYLMCNRTALLEGQVEVIPNWYEDRSLPDIMDLQSKLFKQIKKEDNLVVSYFGNMGIAQDLDTIFETIRILKNDNSIQFMFAGHGNKMQLLKSIIENEQLRNVTVFDFLHGKDFEDALNISDCFLVSLADGLTGLAVPSKTYSYMMAGKPVIAVMGLESDIANDLTNNYAGYAIEVGDVTGLVEAINELKDCEEDRKLMGKNCRNIFLKKYTKEICTQQYVNMIKELLED